MAEIKTIHEIFGSMIFDRRVMREKLNPDIYSQVIDAMEGRQHLSPEAADIVANAMKEWAVSKGATHWSHWFQPQTELTAEKLEEISLINL